jgi:signal transduction histidine kinase/ActR/RegA family two-component response regulator
VRGVLSAASTSRAAEAPAVGRLLWGAAAVALLLAVLQAITGTGGEPLEVATQSTAIALAGFVCVFRAVADEADRPAWILLAGGVFCLGSLGIVYVLDEDATLEFPSELPPGLLGYPFTLLAWGLLARRRLPGLPRALWLDAAIGGLALGVVGGAFTFLVAFDGGPLSDMEHSQMLYVVADLTLVGVMLVAGVLAGGRRARTLLWLAAGMAILAAVDSIYAIRVGDGSMAFPPALAVAWTLGCLVASAAALMVDDPPARAESRRLSLVAVPVLSTLGALSVPLAVWGDEKFLTWMASLVLVLSVARLAISLIDNQRAEERRRREEQERRAREEAERANRAKTAFLSRMSHEVRTPLNSILGFAQLLVDDVDGSDRESVERILRAGNHLRQLIDDILDLSSIEAGETAIRLEPVDVGGSVDESIGLMEPFARRMNVRLIRRDALEAPPVVLADAQRLKQALLNLLSNAIKYGGRDSEVIVRIEGRADRARIAVIDAGPGISDEHLPKLFTPFERGSARGSGIEGSGLGLALTKNLVEAMGGEIGLETGSGGSIFWVELPVTERAEIAATDGHDLSRSTIAAGSKTVLYIEDHLSNVALVERLLARRDDYELVSATTGRAGLKLAANVAPDVILLDLDLPDIRGEDVLVELRADPVTATIPVIVVSADATAWRQEELARSGAAAYIVKPLQLASFLATLDAVLGRSTAAPPS